MIFFYCISILFLIFFIIYLYINKIKYHEFNSLNPEKNLSAINILLVCNLEKNIGGGGTHIINLYKRLFENGHKVSILIPQNSELEQKLMELRLSYYTFKKFVILKNTIQLGLYAGIKKICTIQKVDLINCFLDKEVKQATQIAKKKNIKLVLTHMSHKEVQPKYINPSGNSYNLDGIMFSSQAIEKTFKAPNYLKKSFVPPIFAQERFENFIPTKDKKTFFKDEFNLDIKDFPILCMIANMYKDPTHKNHPILLKAVQKLIYEKNKKLSLILVGDGPIKTDLEILACSLNIKDYVNFLGSTDKTPEILYHSDINILTSKNEAFGIVLLEAGLLKKPQICATGTGAANLIIRDNQTGILFENDNLKSLVQKIELLLDNNQLRKTLGENAYKHIIENFSTNQILKQTENFYKEILTN